MGSKKSEPKEWMAERILNKKLASLTPAQRRTYDEMVKGGRFGCVDTYKPALKLVELKLARVASKSSTGRIEIEATRTGENEGA